MKKHGLTEGTTSTGLIFGKGRRPRRSPPRIGVRETPPARKVMMQTTHTINGATYGPGEQLVPNDIAAMIEEQEQRVREAENLFLGRRAVIVGKRSPRQSSHPLIEVSYDDFDEGLRAYEPAL